MSRRLRREVDALRFSAAHVYNPLDYARVPHERYLERFGTGRKRVFLLGMNPGPWGMVQTGVPFGEVELVRDWMGISGDVARPAGEHPQRPVLGFQCPRSEVSGRRVWTWVRDRFGTPEAFFQDHFVANYCPLAFLEESGRNRTPDKLPRAEQEPLFAACDRALRDTVEILQPEFLVGVGGFAEECLRRVFPDTGATVGRVLHPSPASPLANRGWAERAEADLRALGVPLP